MVAISRSAFTQRCLRHSRSLYRFFPHRQSRILSVLKWMPPVSLSISRRASHSLPFHELNLLMPLTHSSRGRLHKLLSAFFLRGASWIAKCSPKMAPALTAEKPKLKFDISHTNTAHSPAALKVTQAEWSGDKMDGPVDRWMDGWLGAAREMDGWDIYLSLGEDLVVRAANISRNLQ